MSKISGPLRSLADDIDWTRWDCGDIVRKIRVAADKIDAEYDRRMRQQSHDLQKSFCKYMGGVIDDYRHGRKRKRDS